MTLPDISQWLHPEWRPHPRVRTLVTTRLGRHSPPPWHGFNLGMNCGDEPERVEQARRHLHKLLGTDHPPAWLRQVHGDRLIAAGDPDNEADGVWTDQAGWPCAVLTADCLPVLLARTDGSAVAAVHAGWRGLRAGILARAVATLAPDGQALSAWLGPAISDRAYQVGEDVHRAFLALGPEYARAFSRDSQPGHWRFSLTHAASLALAAAGVADIAGGDHCTASDPRHFYSYRAEGQTGRFASLIWLAPA
ncbi:peptidoglycan editing factor PgeF [Alloalcanivorax gelatiniphagus]|uniref:Purine nucleoside phosphorylase n=3 Tax=Alloalcanivorax gelatiniphagus TaxID=1194167 RepID=A0ABY2XS28_9GAMM|nr:peptidoglycan editing factor PgeF [Alloalcanivorax gelatiniphagus]TMW15005.1 peptidoglycan editing factor PgeF [Alloalcanivorax gelatiniphagus]|tara:strand:- start:20612 stop:21361 length:750 start_codon:yes stop_codon:yes gene_type:complete